MTGTTDREILEVALRVLDAWNRYRLPAVCDVAVLRRSFPCLIHLESDDLACHVIETIAPRVVVGHARQIAIAARSGRQR